MSVLGSVPHTFHRFPGLFLQSGMWNTSNKLVTGNQRWVPKTALRFVKAQGEVPKTAQWLWEQLLWAHGTSVLVPGM